MVNYEELEKLQELKNKGSITEQEFETEKQKILNSSTSKAKKKKMPLWLTVVIGIIIAIAIIYIFGTISTNKFYSGSEKKEQEITEQDIQKLLDSMKY